jgi:predicted transcriptional regulator
LIESPTLTARRSANRTRLEMMEQSNELDRYDALLRLTGDRRLNGSDLRCAGIILGCHGENWPSIGQLAAQIGRSRASVERSVSRLDRLGIIHRIPGGGSKRNRYVLTILDQ